MSGAISFLTSIRNTLWTGLNAVNFPVLGVPIMTVLIAVFVLRLTFFVLSVLTGGKQNKEDTGGRLDNNNNYIYRRR